MGAVFHLTEAVIQMGPTIIYQHLDGGNKMENIYAFVFMALLLVSAVSATVATFPVNVPSGLSMEFYNETSMSWQPAVAADHTNSLWDQIIIPGTWMWRTARVNPVEAGPDGSSVKFRQAFYVPKCDGKLTGTVDITTDNEYVLKLNNELVGADTDWFHAEQYNLANLQEGQNMFEIDAVNEGMGGGNEYSNPAGIIFSADVKCEADNDVPEFGAIAAGIALVGAFAGILAFRKN